MAPYGATFKPRIVGSIPTGPAILQYVEPYGQEAVCNRCTPDPQIRECPSHRALQMAEYTDPTRPLQWAKAVDRLIPKHRAVDSIPSSRQSGQNALLRRMQPRLAGPNQRLRSKLVALCNVPRPF